MMHYGLYMPLRGHVRGDLIPPGNLAQGCGCCGVLQGSSLTWQMKGNGTAPKY